MGVARDRALDSRTTFVFHERDQGRLLRMDTIIFLNEFPISK